MTKRYCMCPNEHCFDRLPQCTECDEDGKPHKARRRLKQNADGTVTDIDDGQQFKPKKTKHGTRLVPQFKGRMDWKSAKGFAAMCLIISCLGAEGEYVLWDDATGTEMTEKEWRKRKFRNRSKPPVWHRVCGEVVTSTNIDNFKQGRSTGCSCNWSLLNHWRHRRTEVVAMGAERGFEVLTTEEEWVHECSGKGYCPKFKCLECKEDVTSTCIDSLQQGQRIGCRCNSTHANHWRHRRAEVVQWGEKRGFEVLTTEEEWINECSGENYCPKFKCFECDEEVTSTYITTLQRGRGIGCRCNWDLLNHWRHRHAEVVAMGEERGFEVLTTEEEWVDECSGGNYCPKFKCLKCEEVVTSTRINSLQQGGGIGCSCHNKTEAKLREWLQNKFPQARVTRQYPGPKLHGQTHFDFLLTFPDGFEVLIELDGPQHFWENHRFYTEEGCKRDLAKEEWALAKGMSVVRVLQEDVWEDRLDWQGWVSRSIDKARTVEEKVFTPDTPEYRSTNSVYVQLRPGS